MTNDTDKMREFLSEYGAFDLYDQFWDIWSLYAHDDDELGRRLKERGRLVGRILYRIRDAVEGEWVEAFSSLQDELIAQLWFGLSWEEPMMLKNIDEMSRQLHLVREGYLQEASDHLGDPPPKPATSSPVVAAVANPSFEATWRRSEARAAADRLRHTNPSSE